MQSQRQSSVPQSRITFHVSRLTPRHALTQQSGVALVITLVLLSIITFMAVTFLVVSRSQHGSVATETDQAIARLAADTALERANAELLAPILASTNEFNYGLLVSTNYINSGGFIQRASEQPYSTSVTITPMAPRSTCNDAVQNIANLLYDPRPPVFIVTNASSRKSNDFRFYLDLNRNGRYDPNGLHAGDLSDDMGLPIMYQTGVIVSNFFVGDPEWIGGLQHPEFAHSADNPFVYRYAYIAVPAGQTLDLNTIHNYAQARLMRPTSSDVWPDGFLRNQGVLHLRKSIWPPSCAT